MRAAMKRAEHKSKAGGGPRFHRTLSVRKSIYMKFKKVAVKRGLTVSEMVEEFMAFVVLENQ